MLYAEYIKSIELAACAAAQRQDILKRRPDKPVDLDSPVFRGAALLSLLTELLIRRVRSAILPAS